MALPLFTILGTLLGLTFACATAWSGYVVVCRGLGGTRGSGRLLATLAVTLLIQQGLLMSLSALALVGLHAFRPWIALPVAMGLAWLAHRRLGGDRAAAALREDMRAGSEALREVTASWLHRVLLAWAGVAAGARALAGLVSPPLTWDTLTYHAVKAAEWAQAGYSIRTLAPDQWGYCAFFPDAAETPAAWSMAFLHSDLGLPFVGMAQWAACGLASYALARAIGAVRGQAFRAGLLVAFLPALLGEMVSGYSDMFVLLVFLALGFALTLLWRRRGRGAALFVGACAGLLACAKASGMPIAALALLFALAAPAGTYISSPPSLSVPSSPSAARAACLARGRVLVWATAMALLCAGPHYLRIWAEQGSPFYPFTVRLGSLVLGAGNPELRALYAGKLGVTDPRWTSGLALFASLVAPLAPPKVEFVGFGPAFLLLMPLGAVGLLAAARGDGGSSPASPRDRLVPALAPLAFACLPVLGLMSKDFAGQRAIWLPNLGRLLVALPAALAVLAALPRHRVARVGLAAALVLTLPLAWPRGVANPMLEAIGRVAPWLALAGSLAAFTGLAFARLPRLAAKLEWGMPATIGVGCLALVLPLAEIRAESRYAIYAAAAAPHPAFIMQFTWPREAAAWPLWQAVDDGQPHRIHASYGWDGIGHNELRYPLLGSHLQNRVLYVPITGGDGPIVDYRDDTRLRALADDAAWIQRLRQARIDRVFLGEPPPFEAAMILRHPEHFQLMGRGQYDLHALYRFIP